MGSSVSDAPGGGARATLRCAAGAPSFRLPPLLPLPALLLTLERRRLVGACRKGHDAGGRPVAVPPRAA